MPGCQLDALGRHQIQMRIVQWRHGFVHLADQLLVLMRTRHREHARIGLHDSVALNTEATGDDHLAVFGHGLADGIKAFFLGTIEKSAGVDHHHVCARVVARDLISFSAQLRDDPFTIDQRLGAAERDETDLGRSF